MVIYVDGGSPKSKFFNSVYCVCNDKRYRKVVILDSNKNIYLVEFMALIAGLRVANPGEEIFCDNLQVVREVNLIKEPSNRFLFNEAIEMINRKGLKVSKISRDNNLAGKILEDRLLKISRDMGKFLNKRPHLTRRDRKDRRYRKTRHIRPIRRIK